MLRQKGLYPHRPIACWGSPLVSVPNPLQRKGATAHERQKKNGADQVSRDRGRTRLDRGKNEADPYPEHGGVSAEMAIDGYIIQVDHSDIKAMTAEIQKIGVNINQIARRAAEIPSLCMW